VGDRGEAASTLSRQEIGHLHGDHQMSPRLSPGTTTICPKVEPPRLLVQETADRRSTVSSLLDGEATERHNLAPGTGRRCGVQRLARPRCRSRLGQAITRNGRAGGVQVPASY
jgi:hypothetical protein